MKVTITLDLTNENIDLLKSLISKTNTAGDETPAVELEKPAPVEEKPKTEVPAAVTKADVRALAVKLGQAGKSAALAEIFAAFGATKLSEVDASNYAELKRKLVEANA